MSTPSDGRIDLAAEAIRGAVANLRVALQLLGQVRSEQASEEEAAKPDSGMPAMFRLGGEPNKPESAKAAEEPDSEIG